MEDMEARSHKCSVLGDNTNKGVCRRHSVLKTSGGDAKLKIEDSQSPKKLNRVHSQGNY
jgi:hypothetical protein